MARFACRHGSGPGAEARLPGRVHPLRRLARQGSGACGPVAAQSADRVLAVRARHIPRPPRCGAGDGRLHLVPRRHDGGPVRSTAAAARTECDRRPREQGAGGCGRSAHDRVPGYAEAGGVDRQPDPRRHRRSRRSGASIRRARRSPAAAGGWRQPRRHGAERRGAEGAREAGGRTPPLGTAPVGREADRCAQGELCGRRRRRRVRGLHRRHGTGARGSGFRDLPRRGTHRVGSVDGRRDHQSANARFLAGSGAAVLLPQPEFTPQRLADLIRGFTRDALLDMAQKARALAKPDAARRVADACVELAR